MTLLPGPRLVALAAVVAVASLMLVVMPAAVPIWVAVNCALIGAAGLDWWWSPGPSRWRAVRSVPERLSLNHPYSADVRVTNGSGHPLRFRWRDDPPPEIAVAGGAEGELVVPADETAADSYEIVPKARGSTRWGPLHLRCRSVWGFWEWSVVVPGGQPARIYPALAEIDRYHLLARADRLESLGVRRVKSRGRAEFESLRDYATGDDVRLLDWKATARRSRLTVRQLQTERNQSVILLVDCGRLMTAEEDGVSKLDRAITAALVLGHAGLARGDKVGLATFSRREHRWVVPRGGPGQLRLLTEALYDQRGDLTESDHGRALAGVSARHGKRALLVVLTDFTDAMTAGEMVAQVARAGRRHLVLFAALKDRFLDAAATAEVRTASDGFRRAVALDLLRQRAEVLTSLRHHGVQVVDVTPAELSAAVLNKYLEVTFRGLL